MVTFSGYVDEGRDHLYANMIKHQNSDIRKLGYEVKATHKGSHIEFDFIRREEPKPEPEQAPEA
jgi:predicted metal-dependent phosphotriesterase family hydrolase